MKKLAIIIGVLIAGSPFVSCKKMKDDIKDLKNEISDLQKQNDTLKEKNSLLANQADLIGSVIGSNEPVIATTTFEDNSGATRTISAVYKWKSIDYYTQYMMDNKDGTYYIYIERFSDVGWNEGAWIDFTYNPTTKAVTNFATRHYWRDYDPYSNRARYYGGSYTGLTLNFTVESFDLTTGAISVKMAASGTSAYTSAYSSYAPNPGKPVSTTLSFTGKLKLLKQD